MSDAGSLARKKCERVETGEGSYVRANTLSQKDRIISLQRWGQRDSGVTLTQGHRVCSYSLTYQHNNIAPSVHAMSDVEECNR